MSVSVSNVVILTSEIQFIQCPIFQNGFLIGEHLGVSCLSHSSKLGSDLSVSHQRTCRLQNLQPPTRSYLSNLQVAILLTKLFFSWLAACRHPYRGTPWQLNHFFPKHFTSYSLSKYFWIVHKQVDTLSNVANPYYNVFIAPALSAPFMGWFNLIILGLFSDLSLVGSLLLNTFTDYSINTFLLVTDQ